MLFSIYQNIADAVIRSNSLQSWFDKDDIILEKEKWTSYINKDQDDNLLDHFELEKIIQLPNKNISYKCPEHVPEGY